MVKTKMLYIAYCIAFYDVTVSLVLAQTVKTYTKCVQVGTTSVNTTPFLNSDCISAIDGAIMCTEVAECTVFTYDELTKTCRLYQMIDTVNCDFNVGNGGMTFTKETDCPVDCKRFGNSCYFFENTTKLSWDNAIAYCISQGGYLAEVTDEAEFQLVVSMINDDVYFGCRLYDGIWQWTTSGKTLLLNDTLWAPNEPKDGKCLHIWTGKFDDTGCYAQLDIVCEKKHKKKIDRFCSEVSKRP